ncbi:uncharacterized protein LOC142616310 [Castanea sativa]|uniref:uncharacterized protein LOC142616310 n=1 Tax=Castanea sativa TaxID=21020 RepID=UPI003F64FB33
MKLALPKNIKEVQSLNGKIAALNRFVSRAIDKCLPFFRTLKKAFEWTSECQQAFEDLKEYLSSPPLLSPPRPGEELFLYLVVSSTAVSTTLVREEDGAQKPVYFTSQALRGAEERYPPMEKLIFALVTAARKLKPYFQAHIIVVLMEKPLRRAMSSPEYRPRTATKGQVVADFIAEFARPDEQEAEGNPRLVIYTDGSAVKNAKRAGIVLLSPKGDEVQCMIRLNFPITNNEAEYEALIVGLDLAQAAGAMVLVSDNEKQFDNDAFKDFCSQLKIKNHYSSLAHPQANGQVEVSNRTLLKIIKTRLEGETGIWPEELSSVLWTYSTMVRTPTGETPFQLAYGSEAIIPTEVGLTSYRIANHDMQNNNEAMCLQLNLVDEIRATAEQRLGQYQNLMARHYNSRVKHKDFKKGDLILRNITDATKDQSHKMQ